MDILVMGGTRFVGKPQVERLQAAGHGRSMEEEVRQILAAALAPPAAPASSEPGLGSRIRAHFAQLGGMELEPPRRTSTPEPAALS